jgi:hypothetical protein
MTTSQIDKLITVYTNAAQALTAVRELTTPPVRAYRKANENARTAARIHARVSRSARKLTLTVAAKPAPSRNGTWTPARRKAHGLRMRAMWAKKHHGGEQ